MRSVGRLVPKTVCLVRMSVEAEAMAARSGWSPSEMDLWERVNACLAHLSPENEEGPCYDDSSGHEDLQDQGSVQDAVPHAPWRPPQGISVHRLHPQAVQDKASDVLK